MHAYKRLQLSSQVTAAGAALDGGLPAGLILPLFWAEETSEISDKDAATFRGSAGR